MDTRDEGDITWDEVIEKLDTAKAELDTLLFDPEHEKDLIDLQNAEENNFKN